MTSTTAKEEEEKGEGDEGEDDTADHSTGNRSDTESQRQCQDREPEENLKMRMT